jgi:toxin YoeB
MSAAKRRHAGRHDKSPAVPGTERQAVLLRDFRGDLVYWIGANPGLALRIMRMIEDILKDPFTGIGKPEPLKHQFGGDWSRRITDEHRIVYTITAFGIYFSRARGHYHTR